MNAATCADTVPPLVALGATVTLQSRTGCRELALADLFLKPYQTKAKPDELLTAICFPKLPPDARSAFIKLGRRNALSISRMSVAAMLRVGRRWQNHRGAHRARRGVPDVAAGAEAEQMLLGEKPTARLFAAAGQKVSEEMIKVTGRRWSTEYKEPVLAVLVRRALEQCAGATTPKLPSDATFPLTPALSLGERELSASIFDQARRTPFAARLPQSPSPQGRGPG